MQTVFRCERCGSGFSAKDAAAVENCPQCLGRDRVEAPLTFRLFERTASQLLREPESPSLRGRFGRS